MRGQVHANHIECIHGQTPKIYIKKKKNYPIKNNDIQIQIRWQSHGHLHLNYEVETARNRPKEILQYNRSMSIPMHNCRISMASANYKHGVSGQCAVEVTDPCINAS